MPFERKPKGTHFDFLGPAYELRSDLWHHVCLGVGQKVGSQGFPGKRTLKGRIPAVHGLVNFDPYASGFLAHTCGMLLQTYDFAKGCIWASQEHRCPV